MPLGAGEGRSATAPSVHAPARRSRRAPRTAGFAACKSITSQHDAVWQWLLTLDFFKVKRLNRMSSYVRKKPILELGQKAAAGNTASYFN